MNPCTHKGVSTHLNPVANNAEATEDPHHLGPTLSGTLAARKGAEERPPGSGVE